MTVLFWHWPASAAKATHRQLTRFERNAEIFSTSLLSKLVNISMVKGALIQTYKIQYKNHQE
jgi:hypothetical protein